MSVNIILDGDGALADWQPGKSPAAWIDVQDGRPGEAIKAIYLAGGMASGKPSATIAARTADGRVAVIEMSAEMLVSIARAFIARAEYEGTPLDSAPTSGPLA